MLSYFISKWVCRELKSIQRIRKTLIENRNLYTGEQFSEKVHGSKLTLGRYMSRYEKLCNFLDSLSSFVPFNLRLSLEEKLKSESFNFLITCLKEYNLNEVVDESHVVFAFAWVDGINYHVYCPMKELDSVSYKHVSQRGLYLLPTSSFGMNGIVSVKKYEPIFVPYDIMSFKDILVIVSNTLVGISDAEINDIENKTREEKGLVGLFFESGLTKFHDSHHITTFIRRQVILNRLSQNISLHRHGLDINLSNLDDTGIKMKTARQ
jgi:hypothetical protein